MTTVQRSLEERTARFKQSRTACRDHISRYKTCVSNANTNLPMTNQHPCVEVYLIQNLCTGGYICPSATRDAEKNVDGAHERLAECQAQFLTRLKSDVAAYKARGDAVGEAR